MFCIKNTFLIQTRSNQDSGLGSTLKYCKQQYFLYKRMGHIYL